MVFFCFGVMYSGEYDACDVYNKMIELVYNKMIEF
jgi:hypothetical protein